MERYKKLFNLENDLYHEGSGVIIEAGALLLDTKTDSTLAQLKFKNITSKRIKGIQISLNCFDIGGEELQGVDGFQYLDLEVLPNQEFGSKTPINLPVTNTRSFSIKDCTIYYEDTTQCKLGSVWESLKKAKVKSGSVEFKKQYKIEFGENAQYEYNKYQDLWYCVCGSINREENVTCVCCRAKRERIELLDDEQIESKMLARVAREDEIAKEAREKEERERLEKERIESEHREVKARKRVKTRKILLRVILFASAIAVVAIAIIHFTWGIPNGRYKDACALFEAKKYDEAYEVFVALEDFRDSEVLASECVYQKVVALLDADEYELAREEVNKILGYEKSETMLLEIDYQEAMDFFENKLYNTAVEQFTKLGQYKDSAQMVRECETIQQYDEAVRLRNSGYIKEAAILFGQLDEYLDSKEQSRALWDEVAERQFIASGENHLVALKTDGTVYAAGENEYGECNVDRWTDIVAVAASTYNTYGLKKDGTVVAVGNNDEGQCNISNWSDIVAIYAGFQGLYGLKMDGTVLYTGNWESVDVSNWKSVYRIEIDSLGSWVAGYNVDGTHYTTGMYGNKEENAIMYCDAGGGDAVLLENGTVVRGSWLSGQIEDEIKDWTGVVQITGDEGLLAGLKSDGTILIAIDNDMCQFAKEYDVSNWENVKYLEASFGNLVALREDGTVYVTGYNWYNQRQANKWQNIYCIGTEATYIYAVQNDGTVCVAGSLSYFEDEIELWNNIAIK